LLAKKRGVRRRTEGGMRSRVLTFKVLAVARRNAGGEKRKKVRRGQSDGKQKKSKIMTEDKRQAVKFGGNFS